MTQEFKELQLQPCSTFFGHTQDIATSAGAEIYHSDLL